MPPSAARPHWQPAAAWRLGLLMLAWLLSLPAQAAQTLTVEIDLRAEIAAGRFDPASDQLGLRGSQPPLSWQRSLLAMPLGDGRYALALRFERAPFGGQAVLYKARIERPGQAADQGWEQGSNHALWLDGSAPRVARAFNAPPEAMRLQRSGRIDRLGVVGSAHVAPREVQVWLPPAYGREPQRRFAVLYLHDGQNVFDAAAAGAEWQADETAQRLAEAGEIDAPIIVAVHSGPDRIADYTPTAVLRGGQPQGGGAAAYARFLVDELKPLIDGRYRSRSDAASTAVGGASLGGLVSLWLALQHGQTFGAALVVSPSLWWDDEAARRDVLAWQVPAAGHPRLWLDMGGREGDGALPSLRRLAAALRQRGWPAAALHTLEDPDGGHDEASWASRFEAMMRFLYRRPATPP